jgi:hypothetical protein
MCLAKVTILASVKILCYRTVRPCGRILIQSCWCVYRAQCRVSLCLTLHCAVADGRPLDDGLVKPKHVGAFIVNLNVNCNILKQFNCALVAQIKYLTMAMFRFEIHSDD